MKITGFISILRNFETCVPTQLKRTSSLPPSKLSENFIETLSPKAKLDSYSQETKDAIMNFVQTGDISATSFIKNLIENNVAENDLLSLAKDSKKFNLYRILKSKLNKLLQNTKFGSLEEKNEFCQNLSLLATKDKTSFQNFIDSKGFQEVVNGNLSTEYIRNLKSSDKIGYNHFYDMFANIEKMTNERLSNINGLNKEGIITLIRSMDKEICEHPQNLEDLLTSLEKHNNLDNVNKIIKIFKNDIKDGYVNDEIRELITLTTNIKPQQFNEILKLYGDKTIHAHRFANDLYSITSENNKIDKELFEFLLKNRELCNQYSISDINKFLSIKGTDKNILKKYMNALNKMNENSYFGSSLDSVSENNFEFFKKCLDNGKINEENYFKLLITNENQEFKNPENWLMVDKVYKETFLPIFKSLNKDLYTALYISKMQINRPEMYNKLKQNGILDLVATGKLKSELLELSEKEEFIPEVYKDLEMLKNKKSLVKHFTSFDKILSNTSAGDVMSVNGKIFINNNGRIEPWNMTEEKFNELFPLVERFTSSQGKNDCFLYSAMESLYRNPKTRGKYYKLFEQKGDDIFVTIPAYKDFNGIVKFPEGDVITSYNAGNGAKHYSMLEQAYGRTALRKEANCPVGKNPLKTDDLEYLQSRLHGGQTSDALRDFLNFDHNLTLHLKSNRKVVKDVHEIFFKASKPNDVKNILDKLGNNPNVMVNLGIKTNAGYYHAISLKSYNPQTEIVEIIDPNKTGVYTKQHISELSPNVVKMWFTEI